MKWAREALQYFLLGNPLLLLIDHTPLCWLNSMKDTNPQIIRWYLVLEPYGFQVVYRLGDNHQNADFFLWDKWLQGVFVMG